jgi:hypothetical protein
MEKIIRGSGFTASERYLNRLSDNTFLKLWTYPNTFSDRNKRTKGDGKEICDLLVVCGDDVLVFSDKSIQWPDGANTEVRWSRWYRRAVKKSVDQIRGAERWLRDFPDRVFLDAACTRRLPIELPPLERRRVHGIAIVRGAHDACSRHFEGDEGSLVILPRLKGDAHLDIGSPDWNPFAIGDVDPDGPFVHVFDETALDRVMVELDTVSDFSGYLAARAEAIRSEDLLFSPGEPDLLTYYMKTEDPRDRPYFLRVQADRLGGRGQVIICPGAYEDFVASPDYAGKKKADERSYVWDRLIGEFVKHILAGSSAWVWGESPSASLAEPALRMMARENRLRRRVLGELLAGTLEQAARQPLDRFARVALPGKDSADVEVGYVFMTLAYFGDIKTDGDYTRYRDIRLSMLHTYCYAVLCENRNVKRAVGIALDTPDRTPGCSEDLLVMEINEWTPELEQDIARRRALYDILDPAALVYRHETGSEYPPLA